jgi:hypothetical protein
MRDWLQTQEEAPELAVLAYAAGLEIDLGADAPGAIRRAVLLLATGGDPLRGLEPDGRAVTALAADLDAPERRAELAAGLARVREAADGLPRVTSAVEALAADGDLAWRAFATGVLADSLDE